MHHPRKFPRVFTGSYLYIFTLTLPSAATFYAGFPTLSRQHGKLVLAALNKLHPNLQTICCVKHIIRSLAIFLQQNGIVAGCKVFHMQVVL